MPRNDYSQHQKAVISGYYNNLDTIMLQKLGELVTELYLADTKAKQNRLWQRANKAMVKFVGWASAHQEVEQKGRYAQE